MFPPVRVGIAVGGQEHSVDLLRDAGLAVDQAKKSGKAQWTVFEEEMGVWAAERLPME